MSGKNVRLDGDQFADPGTVPWANWQRSAMQIHLKETRWEATHLMHQLRIMCENDPPAWHLMTTEEGQGFRTFEEFVTTPWPVGLGFPDYLKFRAIILSELKNEREYDLLTMTPARQGARTNRELPAPGAGSCSARKQTQLHAIRRADHLVQALYRAGLIDAKLAERLGTQDPQKKGVARRAVEAVRAVPRNGDDAAYRRAVNDAARKALEVARQPRTLLERAKRDFLKLSKEERAEFRLWQDGQV
jgi:hypothetical protein